MSCEAILVKHLETDCAAPLAKGVMRKGYIIPRADIDFDRSLLSTTDTNRYKTIVLRTGKKWRRIVQMGGTPFAGTKSEMQKGTYRNTFDHTVSFVILSTTYNDAKNIDALAQGEFVIVLENNTPGSTSSAWQIFGMENGMKAEAITREPWNDETLQGFGITMKETGSTRSITYYGADGATPTEATRQLLDQAVAT